MFLYWIVGCSIESLITEEFGHKHLCVVDKTSDIHECIFLCASLIVTTVLGPVCVAKDMPGPAGCVSTQCIQLLILYCPSSTLVITMLPVGQRLTMSANDQALVRYRQG